MKTICTRCHEEFDVPFILRLIAWIYGVVGSVDFFCEECGEEKKILEK